MSDAKRSKTRSRLHGMGMTCPSCEHHVEQALHEPGATHARADFRHNEVVFTVLGELDQASLKPAVKSSRYVPGNIEPLPIAEDQTSELVDCRVPIEA